VLTLKETLLQARDTLAPCNDASARLEAELLLLDVLGMGRTELYMRLEQPLSMPDMESFWLLVQRRLSHEPIAYILKNCQFYGIDFYVDSRALIPRPESELLVEETLKFVNRHFPSGTPCSIVDVGTGSGAIAIALALYLAQARIYATDISAAALEVARINCQKHGVVERVHLLTGNMLEPLSDPVDIILANLPYVRDSELAQLSPDIQMFEPRIALYGGADGLDKMRQLLYQVQRKLLPAGIMLLEIGYGQSHAAASLVRSYLPAVQIGLIPDLGGIDRVVRITI
jgi:release factor glutamine methyltransferase